MGRIEFVLNYLRIFHEVARHRSFTRAAERIHISQPAITRQIKGLEEQLGVTLFRRNKTPIELTEAGKELLRYTEKVFSLLEDAEAALNAYREEKVSVLRIGTTKGYSKTVMPKVISPLQEQNPGIRIILHVDSSQGLQRAVKEREIDIAFLADPDFDEKSLTFIPFREEELVCISAPEYPLEISGGLSLRKVVEFPFIIREKGSGTHKAIMGAFDKEGVKPKILVEASSPEFIKEWVKAGKGISIVTASSVREELKEGKLKALPLEPPLYLHVYIIFLRGRHADPLLESFLRFLGVRA
ncbi:MAG: hypothetical protein DRG40_02400 [Deltaproteobacteria bacterium]|nr:MAG: hypothetical protein DRG40_02400 [Deltaproteobacteria bacterium]